MDTSMRYPHLILLTTILLGIALPGMASPVSQAAIEPDANTLSLAESLDLDGRPAAARRMYDAIERKFPDALPGVPSAINLFALNKIDQAWDYFTQIQKRGSSTDREYASLWLALLYVKDKGKLPVGKERDSLLPDIFLTPTRREIARLYRGDLSIKEFIDFINSSSSLSQRDEFTEIVFFTVGYLRYVIKDIDEAQKIINKNKMKLFSGSLEKPLLEMGKP